MTNEEIALKITAIEDRTKSNTHRIDDLEKRQDNLDEITKSVAVMVNEQEHMRSDIGEIKEDVKDMKSRPSRRIDTAITAAITGVVGAIVGAFVAIVL